MSTRYVWKRANVTTSITKSTTAANLEYYRYEVPSVNDCVSAGLYLGDDFTQSGDSWVVTNRTQAGYYWGGITIPAGKYFYFGGGWTIKIPTSDTVGDDIFYLYGDPENEDYNAAEESKTPLFYAKTACTLSFPNFAWIGEEGQTQWFEVDSGTCHVAVADVNTTVGSYDTYVASSSRYTYPDDDISGSYKYSYVTSGSIDPTAVALSSSAPVSGQSATINVTPRSNSYGTISYLYQYSIDGGSTWTTIVTSSATSCNFTVPTGATSIKVRVRAQDNLGFTSSDYVTSAAYTVTQSTTYAGVSGVVRSVTDYAGVSGAVRSVTTYKGVGGTVRS